jgi:hypothetical protein
MKLIHAFMIALALAAPAAAQDAIDPQAIQVVGGSPDVRSWRVTAALRRVELRPNDFLVQADIPGWKQVTPPGWDGGIQYTLWVIVRKDGAWRTTGSIEFWSTRPGVGGPLSDALHNWWYYAPEIGQPQPGETVGVFIAAGDQRRKDVRSVEERSNIVTLVVPPGDTGTFDFAPVPVLPPHENVPLPPVVPQPTPQPVPAPQPAPLPSIDLLAHLNTVEAQLQALRLQEDANAQAIRQDIAEFRAAVRSKWEQFAAPILKYGSLIAAGFLARMGLGH